MSGLVCAKTADHLQSHRRLLLPHWSSSLARSKKLPQIARPYACHRRQL